MNVQTVLEELAGDELTREHVEQRVEEWVSRIEALYADIERWLPEGWTARRGASVTMHEGPMRRAGIPPRQLPTLEIVRGEEVRLRILPYGLWIIGNNGRLDLIRGRELFFIIDYAKIFEQSDWQIAPNNARRDFSPFDQARLNALLA